MTASQIKTALFVTGSILGGLAIAFPQAATYLTGLGGLLIGWSGLKRPGDVAP